MLVRQRCETSHFSIGAWTRAGKSRTPFCVASRSKRSASGQTQAKAQEKNGSDASVHTPDVRMLFGGIDGANATCDDIRFKLLP
jgi:hypothetical protein